MGAEKSGASKTLGNKRLQKFNADRCKEEKLAGFIKKNLLILFKFDANFCLCLLLPNEE